jgi:spartin
MARNPAYASSSLVQTAAAASRLIVTTSDHIAGAMAAGASKFATTTKPQKPVNFSPSTYKHVRKINKVTTGAAALSQRTVGQVAKIAQNVGASVARRSVKDGKSGAPGLLNKSMIAFSTIADGIAVSGKHLLGASGEAATAMLGHRYGDDARRVAAELTRSVTNVGIVYIDVTGVSRRAVLRSVAKGMLVGKVKGGGQVLVGDGDGGVVPADAVKGAGAAALGGSASFGSAKGSEEEPPTYSPGDYKPADYKPADFKKSAGSD